MNKFKYNKQDLDKLVALAKKMFPEFHDIELAGSTLIFRKAPKNSMINIFAPTYVQERIHVTDFLLTALPERLSFFKSRNTSYVPYYLVGVMAILSSTTPEFAIEYYIQKFNEIEPIARKEEFNNIMAKIQESQDLLESTKASKIFVERLFGFSFSNPREIKLLTLIKNLPS